MAESPRDRGGDRALAPLKPVSTGAKGAQFRAPKTAELVAREIRRRIISGELAEGALLPIESVLIQQLGVSRTALREAFRILESEGLVRVRRGALGGAEVQPPASDVAAQYAGLLLQYLGTTVGDVYRAKTTVELPSVIALAHSHTKDQLAGLREVADEASLALDDPIRSPALHSLFHARLVELGGNQTLGLFWKMTEQIITTANASFFSVFPHDTAVRDLHRAQRAHIKLVELLEQNDEAAAVTLWTAHLEETADMVLQNKGEQRVIDLLL